MNMVVFDNMKRENNNEMDSIPVGRRTFLGATATALWTASKTLSAEETARGAALPNLVFVFADQWRAQATGYSGDPNVRTPHLDRLASESVNCVNAVSGCPVCSPYRASLLTGRYPLTHGVFLNDVCLNTEAVSFAQALNAAGYQTAYIGKWHLDGHGRSNFIPPERRQGFQFWRAQECTHDYNNSAYFADTDEPLKWNGYDAIAQTREAQRYIREETGEKPFALFLSWGPPHNPYETAPEEFRALYEPEKLVLRPNVPETAQPATRRDLAGYYAHCTALDQCVGDLLDALREAGLDENTIFVFTSDHGDMLGSQGEQRKQRPWDEAVRVPLLVRFPARWGREGRRLDFPVNTPDLMPTLLALCGITPPSTVEGRDFSAYWRGGSPPDGPGALIGCYAPFGEWTRAKGGREYRGLRTERYTYVRDLQGPWLLYDNKDDPYQQQNRCGDPAFAAVQEEFDAALHRVLKERGDEFLPGDTYVQRWGYHVDASGTVPYAP